MNVIVARTQDEEVAPMVVGLFPDEKDAEHALAEIREFHEAAADFDLRVVQVWAIPDFVASVINYGND